MFGFILDYLVNVIVLCVAIPVTEKIFDCQIRGFDSLLTYLNIPVTSGTELMMTSAVIVAAAVLVMFFCLYFVPGFDRSLCYSYGGRKPNSLEAAYIQDILMDIEAAARTYWIYDCVMEECIHADAIKLPNGAYQEIIIDKRKIKGRNIFRPKGLQQNQIVVSLAVAESILRRNPYGVSLKKVEMR